jgi:hypothetical protein
MIGTGRAYDIVGIDIGAASSGRPVLQKVQNVIAAQESEMLHRKILIVSRDSMNRCVTDRAE